MHRTRPPARLAWSDRVCVVYAALAFGCGGDKPTDTGTLDLSCAPYPVPEDALLEDVLLVGGRGYVCYLEVPEGLCKSVDGAEAAAVVAEQGPSAAGCEDGVVVIDGTCPIDLRLGECTFVDSGDVWTAYRCGRWSTLPGGEAAGCEAAGGTWRSLP